MKTYFIQTLFISLAALVFFNRCSPTEEPINGTIWHKTTLSFNGPETSEGAEENPFLNYRLMATFKKGEKSYTIPGFYAADGNAAETSASAGNVWQVRFTPDEAGEWTYQISFRKGPDIAISNDPNAGEPVAFDGTSGILTVSPLPDTAKGFHNKGKLQFVDKRYLQFAGSEEYFIKGGAGSPENFLAYHEFDSTYKGEEAGDREGETSSKGLHEYAAHINDWKAGDPTWQEGKGKGIIGALNYLASKGMNSVYFLTMNIGGDGKDVWPYTHYEERTRFDVSKLDQWEIVFDHMDNLGLMLHFVTQETENERLLDDGDTGLQRKLYYRELIARFAHHLAITWNMGEENGPANFSPNGQTTQQQKDMVAYMKNHDPYQNFVVVHTHASPKFRYGIFEDLLGFEYLDGPSLQISRIEEVHSETKTWLYKSDSAGKQWVVNLDEIGPHWLGVVPDDHPSENQDSVRHLALWGNLMGGGGGCEWYFGYKNPHDDLNMEDWRSRDRMWDYTRYAVQFFKDYLPFWNMISLDELTQEEKDYVFTAQNQIYVIYKPADIAVPDLNLADASGNFAVKWYNPRNGGDLMEGDVATVEAGSVVNLGNPPSSENEDWVVMLTKQ